MSYTRTTCIALLTICSSILGSDVSDHLLNTYRSVKQLFMAVDPIARELSTLLDSPNDISLRNYDIHEELYRILRGSDLGETQLGNTYIRDEQVRLANEKMESYAQEYPLSVFYECNDVNCPLSRRLNPSIRNTFDHRVKDRIIQAAQESTPVRYASIGSGGLLQDLRILGLALRHKPDTHIEMHLIDPAFRHHEPLTQNISQRGEPMLFEAMPITRPKTISPPSMSSRPKPRYENVFQQHPLNQPAYFLHVLQHVYPQARITAYLYTSVEEYYHFVIGIAYSNKLYQVDPPDIIVTSDIEKPHIIESIDEMIMYMLEQNQQATALYLLSFIGESTSISEVSYGKIPNGVQRKYTRFLADIIAQDPERMGRMREGSLFGDTRVWTYVNKPLM